VGTTGDGGADVTNKSTYYYRGMLDSFGDEWHIITVGDDDAWVGGSYTGNWASDGKIHYFVVNPKTPLISFKTKTASAQFYTTPAKTYFIPKIHEQTTYLTSDVDIELVNIMNSNPIQYKINNGSTQTYSGPLSSNSLSDGENTLEYWYDDASHKTRTIIKNPDFPSANEQHGYLLWRDDNGLDAIKQRLKRAPYVTPFNNTYRNNYNLGVNDQKNVDTNFGKGLRAGGGRGPIVNAMVALVEGNDAKPSAGKYTFAQYGKKMLLETILSLDPVGFEFSHNSTPIPTKELAYYGYWDVEKVLSGAFTYDLLIKNYRSDQHTDGITPVEDYKIRDLLASSVHRGMLWLGSFVSYRKLGMWGTCHIIGDLMVALAMPSYNTPYYGTSGFDGSPAQHKWAPYPDYPVTWKGVLYLNNTTIHAYPNQELVADMQGLLNAQGDFSDKAGYWGTNLMGHSYNILANVMKMKFEHSYPTLELAYQKCNNGTMVYNGGSGKFPLVLMVNEYFPGIAPGAYSNLQSSTYDLGREMWVAKFYSMILFHDDFNSQSQGTITPLMKTTPVTGVHKPVNRDLVLQAGPNPMRDVIYFQFPNNSVGAIHELPLHVWVYNNTGIAVYHTVGDADLRPLQWCGTDIVGRPVKPGIYYYHINTGNRNYSGRIVKTR
jgi:hypothetical protein